MNAKTKHIMMIWGLVIPLAVPSLACAEPSPAASHPVSSVKQVDLPQYLGKWYEIARLPMFFERNCADNVTAIYTQSADASIQVDNQCRKANGDVMQSIGRATPLDGSNARLAVTFLPTWLRWTGLAQAPYWILKLDPAYSTALVGNPNHKYLWILSRTPHIDPAMYQAYLQEAEQQGFDTRKLILTKQHGDEHRP